MEQNPKFEIGNIVTVHFDNPSSIGYNGVVFRVWHVRWSKVKGEWKYGLESVYGTGYLFAYESEIIFQSKTLKPSIGLCSIVIGD